MNKLDFINVAPTTQTVMALVLMCALFVIVRGLLRRTADKTSYINIEDLLLEYGPDGAGRISIVRVLSLGAFCLTTWVMIFLTLTHKMTEGYMSLFNLAWVGPLLLQIVWGKRPGVALPTALQQPPKEPAP